MTRPEARPDEDTRPLLKWSHHPLTKRPVTATAVIVGVIALLAVVQVLYGHWSYTLAATVGLMGALAPYLFPNRYQLSEAGVTWMNFIAPEYKKWSRFIGYTAYPDGVLLAFPQDLRGRILKGVFLYYGGHREAIMAIVSRKLERPAGTKLPANEARAPRRRR